MYSLAIKRSSEHENVLFKSVNKRLQFLLNTYKIYVIFGGYIWFSLLVKSRNSETLKVELKVEGVLVFY